MSRAELIKKYIKTQLSIQTGLNDNQLETYIQNPLTQQVLNQVKQVVFISLKDQCVYDQLRPQQTNIIGVYAIIASMEQLSDDLNQQMIAHVFQVIPLQNLQSMLLTVLQPLSHNIHYQKPTIEQQEFQQSLSRFTDELKILNSSNMLNHIPYITCDFHTREKDVDKETVVGYITGLIDQMSQLSSQKMPILTINKVELQTNLLTDYETIQSIVRQAEDVLLFYFKFFERLQKCVNQAQSILNDQNIHTYIKDLTLKYQRGGDTTFNKYLAQFEYVRGNFRCQLLENYTDLYEQLKIAVGKQIIQVNIVKVLDFVKNYEHTDIAQIRQIYSALYIVYAKYIINLIKEEIISSLSSKGIANQQASDDVKKEIYEQIRDFFHNSADQGKYTIYVPNILLSKQILSMNVKNQLTIFQKFEEQLLNIQKLNFEVSHGAIQLINQITLTYNNYTQIIQDIRQLQVPEHFETLIETGLQNVQYHMCSSAFQHYLQNPSGVTINKINGQSFNFHGDAYFISFLTNDFTDQFDQLFANVLINVKTIYFNDPKDIQYNQLPDNQVQYIEMEQIQSFNRYIKLFDQNINIFLDQLQPKYNDFHTILQQFSKIYRLNQLSKSRNEISIKYIRIVSNITKQLTNVLQKVIYEAEQRSNFHINKIKFPFYDHLESKQKAILNNYMNPLQLFNHNNVCPLQFSMDVQLYIKQLKLLQEQTGDQDIGKLIGKIATYGCNLKEMVEASSFCGQYLRNMMLVIAESQIFNYKNGLIICNVPYQYEQIEIDYIILKTKAFNDRLDFEFQKPYAHEIFSQVLQLINTKLFNGVQIFNFVVEQLTTLNDEQLSENKMFNDIEIMVNNRQLRKNITELFTKDLDSLLQEMCVIPQFFARISSHDAIILNINEVLQTKSQVYGFYNFIYSSQLQQIQKFTINNFECNTIKINQIFQSAIETIEKQADELYQKFNEMIQFLQEIDHECKLLKVSSQNTITDGLNAIMYNLKSILDLFNIDYNIKHHVFETVQNIIFEILFNKTIMVLYVLYKKTNNIEIANNDRNVYGDIVEPYIEQQPKELYLNALQCMGTFLEDNKDILNINIQIQNNQFTLKPNIHEITVNILTIGASITKMFLGHTYKNLNGRQCTYYSMLQDKSNDPKIVMMNKVYSLLSEHLDKYATTVLSNCQNFVEALEHQAILINSNSLEMLRQTIDKDIMGWIEQYTIISQDTQISPTYQYGIIIINCDNTFLTSYQQNITNIKNFIATQVKQIANQQLLDIIQRQEKLIQLQQQFTQPKINNIIQSININENVYQLLDLIFQVNGLNDEYTQVAKSIDIVTQKIISQEISQHTAQAQQYNDILVQWVIQTCQAITEHQDFNNLLEIFKKQDLEFQEQGNQIISDWTDLVTNLQIQNWCDFGNIQEQLEDKLKYIRELIKQIKQLISAVNILSTIYQDINVSDYKSQLLINNLANIEEDCQTNIDVVCTSLNNIYSQFVQKCSQKYYSYSQEDVVLIVKQFSDQLKSLDKNIRQSQFYDNIYVYYQIVSQLNQVMMYLCNSNVFKKKHFSELQKQLQFTITDYEQLTLIQLYTIFITDVKSQDSQLLKQRISAAQQQLQIAQGQHIIEKTILEIDERWKTMQFVIYNNGTMALISKWNLLTDQLQEDIATLEGLQTAPYYSDFKQQNNTVSNTLNTLSEIFVIWMTTQKKWVHLSSVFTEGNQRIMSGHLLQVGQRYQQADNNLKSIMNNVMSNPLIANILNDAGFSQKLEHINQNLDIVQKQLNKFLEEQRNKSPRLFFIGDEDLLDIISCGSKKDFIGLQKHWKKLFNGVNRVIFKDEQEDKQIDYQQTDVKPTLVGIRSQHNEEIIFKQPFLVDSGTKDLLIHQLIKQIEYQLEISVKDYIFVGIKQIQQGNTINFEKLLIDIPIQCLIVSLGIQWTHKLNVALGNKDKMKQLKAQYVSLLEQCVQLKLLDKCLIMNQNILISQLTYYKNTIEEILVSDHPQLEFELMFKYICVYQNINSLTQFDNFSSVKTISHQQFTIKCLIGKNELPYGYEYHGNDQRIVQTKLTNFCYLIGTNSIINQFGCAPQGKAGSGKTESTKALGILLGRPVLVFNTDENFNEVAVGRILVGACEVGALVVFDEFNRLEENTLSAVSIQLTQIQQGLKSKQKQINNFISDMDKQQITLHPNTAIFITLNPGYAGRRELPDTLKVLMRDVTMNQPDLMQIIEVMLSSNGFLHSITLANKIIAFFQLCSEQMSNQPHYDWGLRAIKSVLISAKQLFSEQDQMQMASTDDQRYLNEENAILNALLRQVYPKLVPDDIQVFKTMLNDIFVQTNSLDKDNEQMLEIIRNIIQEQQNLIPDDEFIQKVLHIYRCQSINTGIILVGPTATGKSSSLRIFFQFMQKMQQLIHQQNNLIGNQTYVQYEILFPKSYSDKEVLFGHFDDSTHEWSDGQFTTVLRKLLDDNAAHANNNKHYYIVFDTVIDPEWVESLNSVLDDNKCLTLPNGERLAIPPNIHLIFEVQDLKNATLATVSRCSIIWYSEQILQLNTKFSGFIKQLQHEFKDPRNYKDLLKNCVNLCAIEQWKQLDQQLSKEVQWGSLQEIYNQLLDHNLLTNDIMGNCQQRYITTMFSILKSSLLDIYDLIEEQFAQITQMLQIRGIQLDGTQDGIIQINKVKTGSERQTPSQENNRNSKQNNYYEILQFVDINIEGLCMFLQRRFILAIGWCFCSSLGQRDRQVAITVIVQYLYNNLSVQLFDGIDIKQKSTNQLQDIESTINSLLYYNTNLRKSGAWEHYTMSVKKVKFVESQVGSAVVSTAETVAQNFLINSWLKTYTTFCLVGPAGSGKSMGLQSALNDLFDIQTAFISFSSHTTPEYLQKIILRYTKKVYRNNQVLLVPQQEGQKLVFLCDEINLPKPDSYGCQRTVEFIRTLTETQQFYDPLSKTTYYIKNIFFTGTCNPPTDPGRYHMDARFMSHCPTLLCDFPTPDSLNLIYTTFLEAIFEKRCKNFNQYALNIAQCMVEVYKYIIKTLTIEKQDHYIYSPRELTRWCRGLIIGLASQDSDDITYELLAKLLYHEGQRIFIDKIADSNDKAQIIQVMEQIIANQLNININELRNSDHSPILFSFLQEISNQQKYVLVKMQDLRNLLTIKQNDYYEEQLLSDPTAERLILSDEMINMIIKIDRVLKQPVGHLLLVGLSGIGKTSISKFVGWMNKFQIYNLQIHSKYTLQDFEELLREMIHKAAIQDAKILFLFDEENVVEIAFLEHLNALLASGEIPGLFEGESQAQLYQQARTQIAKIGSESMEMRSLNQQVSDMTDEDVQHWITGRVQVNLHVIFSANIVNMIKNSSNTKPKQQQTISSPALFNRCVILWSNDWTCGSYLQVASTYISQLKFPTISSDDVVQHSNQSSEEQTITLLQQTDVTYEQIKSILLQSATQALPIRVQSAFTLLRYEIATLMESLSQETLPTALQNDIKLKLCTPRHFLRSLRLFLANYAISVEQERNKISHIQKGLETLRATNLGVVQAQQQLDEQTRQLNQAQTEADQALSAIVERKSQVQKQHQEVEQLLQDIKRSENDVEEKKKPINQKLEAVEPEIEAAKQAIKGIEKKNLDELKQLQRPPDLVLKAMQAVILLIGSDQERIDLSWDNIRRILRRPDFLKSMLEYDAATFQLPGSVYKQLQENYVKSLNAQSVGRASSAAGPMFQWVLSVFKYQEIYKGVEPLMKEISTLEKEQDTLKQKHKESQKEFKALDADIAKLEADYKQMFAKQQQLSHQQAVTKERLETAQALLASLQAERSQWDEQVSGFQNILSKQIGSQIIITLYNIYGLALPQQSHKQFIQTIIDTLNAFNINHDGKEAIEKYIDDVGRQIRPASQQASHSDVYIDDTLFKTISNLFAIPSTSLYPNPETEAPSILFDVSDQSQMSNTLKILLGDSAVVTSAKSQDFIQNLQRALKLGKQLIVTDNEYVDATLSNVIDFAGQMSSYMTNLVMKNSVKQNNNSQTMLIESQLNASYNQSNRRPEVEFESLNESTAHQNVQIQYYLAKKINIGGVEVEGSGQFRLFLIFPASGNNQVLPGIFSRTQVLYCGLTVASLTQKLQQMLLNYECPRLSQERREMAQNNVFYQQKLVQLQKNLLDLISNVEPQKLLEDDNVKQRLQFIQKETLDVKNKQQHILQLQEKFSIKENLYENAAVYISELFFLTQKLRSIIYSGQYSIDFFMYIIQSQIQEICITGEEQGASQDETLKRMQKLSQRVTKNIYTYISCSLSEIEQQSFALGVITLISSDSIFQELMQQSISHQIEPYDKQLMFYGSQSTTGCRDDLIKAQYHEICKKWNKYQNVDETFVKLLEQYGSNEEDNILQDSLIRPENCLQTMVLTISLQPLLITRIIQKIFNYVVGPDIYQLHSEIKFSDLVATFNELKKPFLIIINGYADPTRILQQTDNNVTTLFYAIGQKECIPQNIRQSVNTARGKYRLVVQNIHLASYTMQQQLHTLSLELLAGSKCMNVIFTTMLSPLVSQQLYNESIKYCLETPTSLSLQYVKQLNDTNLYLVNKGIKNKSISHLCNLVTMVHSIITVRGKFVPNGFIKDYEYGNIDLQVAVDSILTIFQSQLQVQSIDISPEQFIIIQEYLLKLSYANKAIYAEDVDVISLIIKLLINPEQYSKPGPIKALNGLDVSKLVGGDSNAAYNDIKCLGLQPVAEKVLFEHKMRILVEKYRLVTTDAINVLSQNQNEEQIIIQLESWNETYLQVPTCAGSSSDPVCKQVFKEVLQCISAIQTIKQDVQGAISALKGEIRHSKSVSAILTSIKHGDVPESWQKLLSNNQKKLTKFFEHLRRRSIYLSTLCEQLNSGKPLDEVDLDMLGQQTALFTSLKQAHARKLGVQLDQLRMRCTLRTEVAKNGIRLTNVSAIFAEVIGTKVVPSNARFSPVDGLCLEFSADTQAGLGHTVPLYSDIRRRQLLLNVQVELENPEKTLLNGTCFVLNRE